MYTFYIAAEGKTDFEALKHILVCLCTNHNKKCHCEPIFPHEDANIGTEKLRGVDGMRKWCMRNAGTPASSIGKTQHDKHLLSLSGFVGFPTVSSMPSWTFYHNANPLACLVFHLDGDIAETLSQHHPHGKYSSTYTRNDYCRRALQHWTGLNEEDALWCVPVQCLETWFLTLHTIDECKCHMPTMQYYESIASNQVCETLFKLGHTPYKDVPTVNKADLTQKHSQSLAKAFDNCAACCPSAARFAQDVYNRLQ